MPPKLTGDITIEQVLAELQQYPNRAAWICFVKGQGKNRGDIRVVAKCRQGYPKTGHSRPGSTGVHTERKAMPLHVERGTIPLTCLDTGQLLTPFISHIIGYNLKNVVFQTPKPQSNDHQ
jgi:hypothetical protein